MLFARNPGPKAAVGRRGPAPGPGNGARQWGHGPLAPIGGAKGSRTPVRMLGQRAGGPRPPAQGAGNGLIGGQSLAIGGFDHGYLGMAWEDRPMAARWRRGAATRRP